MQVLNKNHKKRLKLLALVFLTFSTAVALLLYAMREELNHFYSLEAVATKIVPINQKGIRVGGMVEKNSLQREGESLTVRFRITDFKNPTLPIEYTGILPDLFREGQGIIARGTLQENGVFLAEQILAKHDETYVPPEIKELAPHQK